MFGTSIDVFRVRRHQPTRLEGFVDASFAFAVTLIVISIGKVPNTVPDMLAALRGLPTFAACFLMIARFWKSHRDWSRFYDIEDSAGIGLSLALVFLILVYVYPLRFLFTLMFSSVAFSGRFWLVEAPVRVIDVSELRAAYAVFGIGLAAIAVVFAALFTLPLKRGTTVALDADETLLTKLRVRLWLWTGCVAAVSTGLALLLPLGESTLLVALPGEVYLALFIIGPVLRRRAARRMALVHAAADA